MSTPTLSVMPFREPRHYIHPGTKFILEAADDNVYAIGRQVLPSLEMVTLTPEEKARAHEMSLITDDDDSRLEQLKQLVLQDWNAKQYAYYVTVLPSSLDSEQPGVYGIRKDGTKERIRDY